MLTLTESEERAFGYSLYYSYSCNFSVDLKLFPNKTFFLKTRLVKVLWNEFKK